MAQHSQTAQRHAAVSVEAVRQLDCASAIVVGHQKRANAASTTIAWTL
jgi:hypothetical protein